MIWVAIALFLVSLLAVLKPPFYQAWLLSVAVAGIPWVFAVISLCVFLAGTPAWPVMILAGLSFVLFLVPVMSAWVRGAGLKKALERAFPLNNPPNHAAIPKAFRFWLLFAGPLSKKVPFQRLAYGTAPGERLELDFYPSQASGPCPCVVVIHGGSWSGGHSGQLPELNSRLARSGYHVAAINYRLAPKHLSPGPVEDVLMAVDYLRQQAPRLQIAADQFVLLGRSAGGQIALQAAYGSQDSGIRGVIAYYAPADMVWGYLAPASPWIMDSCKVLEAYLGGSYQSVPINYKKASPLESVKKHAIPTLLIHGRNDVLVTFEHSVRLAGALHARGTPYFFLRLPFGTHGFDYVLDGPEGQQATFAVRYFLRAVFSGT